MNMTKTHWAAVVLGGVVAMAQYLAGAVPEWAVACHGVSGAVGALLPLLAMYSPHVGDKK